jgi:hypothetical protein
MQLSRERRRNQDGRHHRDQAADYLADAEGDHASQRIRHESARDEHRSASRSGTTSSSGRGVLSDQFEVGIGRRLELIDHDVIISVDDMDQLDLHPNGPGVPPIVLGHDTPVPLERDRWLCLQMEIGIGGAGSAKLSVDGTVAAVSTGPIETLPPAGYRNISAGIVYSDADQQPIQLLLDEVGATPEQPARLARLGTES